MRRVLALLLALVIAAGVLSSTSAPAGAADSGKRCHFWAMTSGYAEADTSIDTSLDYTLPEWKCRIHGLRMLKVSGSTLAEVEYLERDFRKYASGPRMAPAVVCSQGLGRVTVFHLLYYYTSDIKVLTPRVWRRYGRWVDRYLARHGNCGLASDSDKMYMPV